ncbi:MAG: hypothetical protein EHM64_01105 [Ignavibacteriae bacterium]|nr:MAG: hypothetical protein EHM64_01105 [Ignavibacteriota bacterium]
MMKKILFPLFILSVVLGELCSTSYGQSGPQFQRSAYMNGNQVRTVFGNWGVIGQPAAKGKRGAWRNDNDGYIGDVTPLVGAEINYAGKTFHSVATCFVERPAQIQDQDPLTSKWWTFQPDGGYFNTNQQSVAMSNDPNSWPPFWPDKLNDTKDPGWRGSWNGYFGKRANADLETYFVMDDNNDERFNKASNNTLGVAFKPDSTKPQRNGMALVMSVRAMQWSQFLAKDNIFWLYEITNTGTTTYNRAVFGMLVGTYVGVTSTEDYREYADDWSFYSAKDNITYTGDYGRQILNPLWVGTVGMVGYAFLESPGNPFDGIDNDGDADSSAVGQLTPKFTSASFDSTLITPGMQLVLIRNDYSRFLYTVPSVAPGDSLLITTRGLSTWIKPGITKVAEGNVLQRTVIDPTFGAIKVDYVNPNAYDGVDNDFDGIIDENYYVHYRQLKRSKNPANPPLIDQTRPLHYTDFITGNGTSPTSMIDERRNDLIDNNTNWNIAHDDVGRDGIPNTGDLGEGDGIPTSGYDANGNDTGLPGEPHIDKTDVRESDQIGLTNFYYFAPSNQVRLGDDESMWTNLAPGFFDVPASIVNNRPTAGEDGDFIYGSGYFPLLSHSTERFSLALVYGGGRGGSVDDDIADLLKNKQTVQQIYDANYQFPQPPDKPTLTAVAGDKQVTLYWDRKAEASVDPVLLTKDFEGYKLYKSTDPDFRDIYTITDGSGSPQGYRPLVQVDIVDGVQGYFQATGDAFTVAAGYAFYLGSDNGLQHSYVDNDVQNGRRYYYALVAYDKGDNYLGIFPSENSKFVTISTSGEITHDPNVAVVVPNTKVAGYVPPPNGVKLSATVHYGTGDIYSEVLDPNKITRDTYRLEFLDSRIDGIDNNDNGLIDAFDSTEATRTTSFYSVRDMNDITEIFYALDTTLVTLERTNLVRSSVVVRNSSSTAIPASNYILDTLRGNIRGASPGSMPAGRYTITYQYYPVYRSSNIYGSPYVSEAKDADIFDGIQLSFRNQWQAQRIDSLSVWTGKDAYRFGFTPLNVQVGNKFYKGIQKPSDYSIIFSNSIVDTSTGDPDLQPDALPVNFRVYNETDSTFIKFIYADIDANGKVSPQDELVFLEKEPLGNYIYTWDIKFSNKQNDPIDTVYALGAGDKLSIKTTKPFRQGDNYLFTPVPAKVDEAAASASLRRVRVVPNPYVTASTFELPLNPGVTSGRGQRKIDFIHVPSQASIQIFTSRGDHIMTLRHDGNIEDGTVSWNVKTKENLDVAYGVYYYVVESTAGTMTGKFAIIK